MAEMAKTDTEKAFAYMIEFLRDCNPNWAKLVEQDHTTPRQRAELVNESINDRIYVNIVPFTEGIDEAWVLKMTEKYDVKTSPVTFKKKFSDGKLHTVTTKRPILIGGQYMFHLHKDPHQSSSGLGYVNQYHSPMRPNELAKSQYPFSQTTIRLGEDEIRNIIMTSGPEVAAHIMGAYANSPDAVENLANHLLTDKEPSKLEEIDMSLEEIIKNNNINGVTRHIFATIGINITPTEQEVDEILKDAEAAATAEEVEDLNSEALKETGNR